jgi:GrpB-like predicted nucleotidyltransferase (UPF0157 family)
LTECHDASVRVFTEESSNIKSIIEKNFVNIYHIGSTAVPNLIAKPQIDIALEVYDLEKSLILGENKYIYKGELNIPFRYFFGKAEGEKKVNLHVFEKGNPEIKGFLMFRDYMKKHREAVLEYSELKQKIALMENISIKKSYGLQSYTLMKNDFIRKILKEAGFKGLCVRYPAHYSELEYIGEIDHRYIYVVFYEGPDIVGYSKVCKKSRKVQQFEIENNQFFEYFLKKVKKIAERVS